MSRSAWKKLYLDKKILQYKYKNIVGKKYIRTRSRSSAIPQFCQDLDISVGIYNGKIYKSFKPSSRKQYGYKFGEFAFTRKHNKSKKSKKKKTKGK